VTAANEHGKNAININLERNIVRSPTVAERLDEALANGQKLR